MSGCSSKLNQFCYICGKSTIMPSRKKISDEIGTLYEQYFNIQVIRNVEWVPAIACSSCINRLQRWAKGEVESMPFGIPMVWTDPGIHTAENCYACANGGQAMNRFQANKHTYVSVQSAQRPLPHSDLVPIPKKPSPTEEYVPPTFTTEPESAFSLYQPSNVTPACNHIEITQNRLDIMSRQLKLSQARQILLTQHLKAVNILARGRQRSWPIFDARGRQRAFLNFFERNQENTFAFCKDIHGLMAALRHEYNPRQWRLFIDSSKSSLKAILLFSDNTKNPVPLALSTKTQENYESMKNILNAIKYTEHKWKICADLKVISLLCGLQLGYTKNMCFLCQWDTRFSGNQYKKKDWPLRQSIERVGRFNVVQTRLVDSEDVLLPPLHIKLGLVKNFIKALVSRQNERAYERLQQIFPRLSKMKIKEGVLNGPDIRRLMKDEPFLETLMEEEAIAWDCLKAVIENVLGLHRVDNWRILVDDMLHSFENIGVNMSLKVHFMHFHQEKFDSQMPSESDEHGERFHQVSAQLEHWYSGKKLNSLLADLCWNLQNNDLDDDDDDENCI